MAEKTIVVHPFEPVYDCNSEILILGSLPSVKSRENNFYYGHPQNRLWKVLAAIFNEQVPKDITQKTELLLKNKVALWDVIKSCTITGSSDSSIKNAVPNDIGELISKTHIKRVFTNGKKAYELYQKHCSESTGIDAIYLPSTSPANSGNFSFEDLCREWGMQLIEKKKGKS